MALRKNLAFFLLLFITVLVTTASAASSLPQFCKCMVGLNSSIIPLNHGRAAPNSGTAASPQSAQRTCADCNRQFCIEYNLPFVKGVKEEEISTMCFQRDSYKDRAVVYTFIVLTVGLLVYAGLRPWIDAQVEAFRERRSYVPLGSNQ